MNIFTQCCGLSLLIAQFTFILSQKSLKLFRQRVFKLVLAVTTISVVLDILSVFFIYNQSNFSNTLVKFVAKLYIVSLSWDGFIAFIYMMLDTVSRKSYTKIVIPMIALNLIVSIVAFILPIEIVYSANDVLYTQGPSTLVVYSSAAIHSALIIITCFVMKKHIFPRKRLCMILWVIFLVSAALVQLLFKQILIISFAMSLGSLLLFVLVENPESNIDRRLGCFNSYAKSILLSSFWNEGKKFSVFKVCFNENVMTGLDEKDRTLTLENISNYLSSQGKFYVFKENDSSFSVVATDYDKLEKHMGEIWNQICTHEPYKGNTTLMLLKDPYILNDAIETEDIFVFSIDEGLTDIHLINVIDENVVRKFHVKKMLIDDPSKATNFADEASFFDNRKQRLQRLEIIDLFASEYDAVFHVDILTGSLTPYAMNGEEFNDLTKPFTSGMQFLDAFEIFCNKFVYSEDLENFKTACTLKNIKKELLEHKSYSIIFRCLFNSTDNPVYCEMKFMRFNNDQEEFSSFVLGIANRDDAIRKEQAEARQRSQYHAVIQALSSEYGSIYYAELDTNFIIPYACSDRVSDSLGEVALKKVTFTMAVETYINSIVTKKDKEMMRSVLSIDNIRNELKDKQYFVHIYQNEVNQYCEMKCVRTDENELVNHIVVGFAVKDSEIRKRMMQEEKLMAALKDAEIANKSKTDFLFNMSHDIRTPMNAITGFTRMAIRDINTPEKVLHYLEETQKASSMLLSLINDILDMSRIESGHVKIAEKPGDISELFADIEPMMQELAKDKKIKLEFCFNNITDKLVCFDAMRTERILVNVISNAVKYTHENGWVKVCCTQKGRDENNKGIFEFTVEDNGIGMSQKFQEHLFEQFSREENSTTSKIQGTGLGLALCKSLTDLMGGTITAKSTQGVGSKFIVTLPFNVVDENKAEYLDKDEVHFNEDILVGKRVLVVDDNSLNREIAADILSETGLIVECAESGKEAISLVSKNPQAYYDFILMDILMPMMNGYETTIEIRKLEAGRKIPIIALSANAFEEDKQKSIASGMNDHVAKPINVNELKTALAKLL